MNQIRHTQKTVNVNDGTYIGFMVLMAFGGILAWFLVPPEKIVRKDGSRVQQIRHPSAMYVPSRLYVPHPQPSALVSPQASYLIPHPPQPTPQPNP